MTDVSDAGLRRAIAPLEDAAVVIFGGRHVREGEDVQRASPAVCARGHSTILLPGEGKSRELRPFELEAILELARAGEVRILPPFIPGLGHGGRPRRAPFRLEDGSIIAPDSEEYPLHAVCGA